MPAFDASLALDAASIALLLAIGVIAGFLNVTGGAGSLLTVPLLVVLGLPSPVANGTNRIALIAQNITAVAAFRRGGIRGLRAYWPLFAVAAPGSVLGALLGAAVSDAAFRRVLGATLVLSAILLLLRPPVPREIEHGHTLRPRTLLAFAALGFYAGFVQAGIGFLIVLPLALWERLPLMRCHAVKVLFVLVQQGLAFPVYALHGLVDWNAGLVLALGLAGGGALGARVALGAGEKVLRVLFVGTALVLAVKMFFG